MCSLTGHTPLVRPTSLSQVGTAVWNELTGHSPLSAHNPFTGRHSYLKWSHWSQSSLSACFPFTGRCSCQKWAHWSHFLSAYNFSQVGAAAWNELNGCASQLFYSASIVGSAALAHWSYMVCFWQIFIMLCLWVRTAALIMWWVWLIIFTLPLHWSLGYCFQRR